jgi:RNA polymerase sigma-70 factor (ECF subfamily)
MHARALDPVAADDLVLQALLNAYEKWATFKPGSSLRAWLFAILHNQSSVPGGAQALNSAR